MYTSSVAVYQHEYSLRTIVQDVKEPTVDTDAMMPQQGIHKRDGVTANRVGTTLTPGWTPEGQHPQRGKGDDTVHAISQE